MTVFNPDQHFMLFLTSLNGVVDYNTFQDKAKGMWAKDAFMSAMHSAGILSTVISDSAPSSQNVIWVDPNDPSTAAPSVVRIFDTASNSWKAATIGLFAQLLARVGGFSAAGSWTNATRPEVPQSGQAGYNTQSGNYEFWTGTAWQTVGGSGSLPTTGTGYLYRNSAGVLSYAPRSWTTASRPASPFVGQSGMNTDTLALEFWNGTAWDVAGGGSGGSLPASSPGLLRDDGTGTLTWVPVEWTTATRPATPYTGQFGTNTTTGLFEFWDGTAWQNPGGSGAALPADSDGVLRNDGSGGLQWSPVTWTTATRPAAPYTGQEGYNTTTGEREFWDGTGWRIDVPVNPVANGVAVLTDDAAGNKSWSPVNWTTATRPATPYTGQAGYNTTTGEREQWNGAAWEPVASTVAASAITAATTAVAGNEYWADTSGSAFTVTLPAAPAVGDRVTVYRVGANDATINGNGSNIAGNATLVLNVDKSGVELVFILGQWQAIQKVVG